MFGNPKVHWNRRSGKPGVCGKAGRSQTTNVPSQVTCGACKRSSDYLAALRGEEDPAVEKLRAFLRGRPKAPE